MKPEPIEFLADMSLMFIEVVKDPYRKVRMSDEEMDTFGDRMLLLIANLKGEKRHGAN